MPLQLNSMSMNANSHLTGPEELARGDNDDPSYVIKVGDRAKEDNKFPWISGGCFGRNLDNCPEKLGTSGLSLSNCLQDMEGLPNESSPEPKTDLLKPGTSFNFHHPSDSTTVEK